MSEERKDSVEEKVDVPADESKECAEEAKSQESQAEATEPFMKGVVCGVSLPAAFPPVPPMPLPVPFPNPMEFAAGAVSALAIMTDATLGFQEDALDVFADHVKDAQSFAHDARLHMTALAMTPFGEDEPPAGVTDVLADAEAFCLMNESHFVDALDFVHDTLVDAHETIIDVVFGDFIEEVAEDAEEVAEAAVEEAVAEEVVEAVAEAVAEKAQEKPAEEKKAPAKKPTAKKAPAKSTSRKRSTAKKADDKVEAKVDTKADVKADSEEKASDDAKGEKAAE